MNSLLTHHNSKEVNHSLNGETSAVAVHRSKRGIAVDSMNTDQNHEPMTAGFASP